MRVVWLGLVLTACSGSDVDPDKDLDVPTGDTDEVTTDDAFALVGDSTNLPAAGLLSLWGTSSSDMWFVGADDGTGPTVLHYDGAGWERLATGSTGDLWWVWSAGGDKVYFVGEGARLVTYDKSSMTFTEEVIANGAYILFGMWGTSDTDIYAVGGDINNNLAGTIVHYDGTAWTEVATAPSADGVSERQAFKVWGSASDDVFVVGTGALFMHWDGATWTTEDPAPLYGSTPVTTVHGSGPDNVYAVGGFGNAAVAHYDGTAWSDDSPPPLAIAPFFNGVFSTADRGTVACGGSGSIWWRGDTEWAVDPRNQVTTEDFHACWIDETGAVWAVGGDLQNLDEGVIVTDNPSIAPVAL